MIIIGKLPQTYLPTVGKVLTIFEIILQICTHRPGVETRYNFSSFTCSLNEMEEGIPITDSRNRPDQRTMENGDFDEANRIKVHCTFDSSAMNCDNSAMNCNRVRIIQQAKV